MKRISALLAALLLVFCSLPFSAFAEKDAIYDLELDSQGVYVVNLETDTALYEKAADARMFPASITKIMTAMVVLEMCPQPQDVIITVPQTAMFQHIIDDGGVNMQLEKGESFTAYDLLAGLMLYSYCDAGELLAYHFGGENVSAFVEKMNEKAKELGLEKSTHFANAHGLHHPDHYSTPRDAARFFQAALEIPLFREIISTRSYTIPATECHGARSFKASVGIYHETDPYHLDAFVGGKSGFTDQAGRCLATYSEKDGVSYISVLLGANMDANRNYTGNMAQVETHLLISYAYENYQIQTVLEKGTEVATIPVTDSDTALPVLAGEEIRVLTRKGTTLRYSLVLPEAIPVTEVADGKQIGHAKLISNEEEAKGSYPLLLSWNNVPIVTRSVLEKGAQNAANAVTGIFRNDKIFVTLLIILLLVIAICIPAFHLARRIHSKKSHRPKH